jgi:hypothetical protein
MASNTDNSDIEKQLRRLGEKLSSLSEDRLEAFFDSLGEEDSSVKPALAVKLKGPRISTAISISRPLLDKLKRYMAENGVRSSVSAVVEYLVWEYLDCPDELIEKTPRVNRPRGTSVRDPQNKKFFQGEVSECLNDLREPIESINNDTHLKT